MARLYVFIQNALCVLIRALTTQRSLYITPCCVLFFLFFFATAQTPFFVVLDCAFQRFIVEIVGVKHQLFRHQKLRLIHAHASCSAVIPLYLTKPITAKGAAPRIYTQLSVSIPKYGRRIKYSPIATLQASKEKTNYRSDSPKNIFFV